MILHHFSEYATDIFSTTRLPFEVNRIGKKHDGLPKQFVSNPRYAGILTGVLVGYVSSTTSPGRRHRLCSSESLCSKMPEFIEQAGDPGKLTKAHTTWFFIAYSTDTFNLCSGENFDTV